MFKVTQAQSRKHRFADLIDLQNHNNIKPDNIKLGVFHLGPSPPSVPNDKTTRLRNRNRCVRLRRNQQNSRCQQNGVCSICTETMKGRVTLRCGHEMCPTCFAMHSRENHRCPFCRDEFAPVVRKKVEMPIQVAEAMMTNTVQEYFFETVCDHIDILIGDLDVEEIKTSVYAHMCQVAMNMIQDVEQWYEENK